MPLAGNRLVSQQHLPRASSQVTSSPRAPGWAATRNTSTNTAVWAISAGSHPDPTARQGQRASPV